MPANDTSRGQAITRVPAGVVVFVALVSIALSLLLTLPSLDTASRSLVDTDGYMRFVRVFDLGSGQVGWFESIEPRSNAPFGHSMHWTRPVDVIALVGSTLLVPFLDFRDALYWTAVAMGPAFTGVLTAVVTWAAYPLVGRAGALVAGFGVVLQPGLAAYGAFGRFDHHGLILVCAGVLIGLVIRLGIEPRRGSAVAAGVTAGIGVWVSTEFLFPIALALAVAAVCWLLRGGQAAIDARRASMAWAVTVAAALLVERGPVGLTNPDLDRLSWVHLLIASLIWGFWTAAAYWGGGSLGARLGQGLIGGGVVVGVVLLAVPRFLGGPFGDVPPELWEAWLGGVAELQPLWPVGDGVGRAVYLLSAPVLALLLALVAARRSGVRAAWWGIAGALGAMTVLAVLQLRFSTYAQLVATLAWGWLAAFLLVRIGESASLGRSMLRVGAMALGVAGFLVPILLLEAFEGERLPVVESQRCDFDEVVRIVEQSDTPIVLAHIDDGPRLLHRTDAQVLAAPYHRNVDGILAARDFLLGNERTARRIADDRGVDLVFVCPDRDRGYLGVGADEEEAMYARLVGGEVPTWLEAVPTSSNLLAFRIVG